MQRLKGAQHSTAHSLCGNYQATFTWSWPACPLPPSLVAQAPACAEALAGALVPLGAPCPMEHLTAPEKQDTSEPRCACCCASFV